MTVGEWLTVVGLLLTLAMFGTSIVVGVIGYFLTGLIRELKESVHKQAVELYRLGNRQTRIETILADRGLIPHQIKFPSPPPTEE